MVFLLRGIQSLFIIAFISNIDNSESFYVSGSINYGVLNVFMPQIILDQARIYPSVSQGIAAGVAKHVRMHLNANAGHFTVHSHQSIQLLSRYLPTVA